MANSVKCLSVVKSVILICYNVRQNEKFQKANHDTSTSETFPHKPKAQNWTNIGAFTKAAEVRELVFILCNLVNQ